MRWLRYILFLLFLIVLSVAFMPLSFGQSAWQRVGNENVGVRARAWLDAEKGTFSKGRPVLVDRDTLRSAWLATKYYADSLHADLSGSVMTITGNAVKSVTVTRPGGQVWMNTSFTDNDNQTLSVAGDSLSISGGNSVKVLPNEPVLISTGSNASTYTLPTPPISGKHVQVFLNNAIVYPQDYQITGNTINFLFSISTTDYLSIFFKSQ